MLVEPSRSPGRTDPWAPACFSPDPVGNVTLHDQCCVGVSRGGPGGSRLFERRRENKGVKPKPSPNPAWVAMKSDY